MVAAIPETLGTVVSQILAAASQLADEGSQEFTDIMNNAQQQAGQMVDKITKLPDELLQRLRDFANDPDWNTLLIFVFLQIQKLDPEQLIIGTMQAAGFVPAVTLTYTETGDISGKPSIGVSPGRMGDNLKKGLHLRFPAGAVLDLGSPEGLSLSIKSQLAADWDWDFGQTPSSPGASGQVNIRISWRLPIPAVNTDIVKFSVGPVILDAMLRMEGADVSYTVGIGLGDKSVPADHGLTAALSIDTLLGDFKDLADVKLPDVDYSPHLALSKGAPPEFNLA